MHSHRPGPSAMNVTPTKTKKKRTFSTRSPGKGQGARKPHNSAQKPKQRRGGDGNSIRNPSKSSGAAGDATEAVAPVASAQTRRAVAKRATPLALTVVDDLHRLMVQYALEAHVVSALQREMLFNQREAALKALRRHSADSTGIEEDDSDDVHVGVHCMLRLVGMRKFNVAVTIISVDTDRHDLVYVGADCVEHTLPCDEWGRIKEFAAVTKLAAVLHAPRGAAAKAGRKRKSPEEQCANLLPNVPFARTANLRSELRVKDVALLGDGGPRALALAPGCSATTAAV